MTPDTQTISGIKTVIHVQPGQELYVTLDIPETEEFSQGSVSYCVKLTYEDLLHTVRKPKLSMKASRKSKSPETNLSRHICLLARAIETGKWATGSIMMRNVALEKLLVTLMSSLRVDDAHKLTAKARAKLTKISKDWTCMNMLTDSQMDYFMKVVEACAKQPEGST